MGVSSSGRTIRACAFLCFFHDVVVSVARSRAARFDDEHCRLSAAMRKRRSHWAMSQQSESAKGWGQTPEEIETAVK